MLLVVPAGQCDCGIKNDILTTSDANRPPNTRGGNVRWIGYLGLCAAYLQGGINKLLDFQGAIVEMNHFGLSPAPLFAVLVITLELGASLMILIGCQRWRDSLLSPHFWPCVSGNYLTAWRDSVPLTHFFNIWVLSAVF